MRRLHLVFFTLLATGIVQAQEGSVEVTYEGLTKRQKGLFRESWVDLDVDFTKYDKIIPIDPHFEFRAVKRSSPAFAHRFNQRKFYINDSNRERLIETVSEIFSEELQNSSHFTIVDEPDPDVAILRVGILDIVSRIPPERVGRSEIYLSSVGEGTLVVELRDSLSLETIYRGVERSAAQRPGGSLPIRGTVTSWPEVRRLARRWALTMREGLDSIHNQAGLQE